MTSFNKIRTLITGLSYVLLTALILSACGLSVHQSQCQNNQPTPLTSPSTQLFTISSPLEVEKLMGEVNPDTLAVFDMDNTLAMSSYPQFQHHFYKKIDALRRFKKQLPEEDQGTFISFVLLNNPLKVPDPGFPLLVKALQARGAKVVVATASATGPLLMKGLIPALRWRALYKLGYDFSLSFPKLDTHYFTNIPLRFGRASLFYKGLLLSNGRGNKATLVGAFLSWLKWQPSKVIFVDDSHSNVAAMSDFFAKNYPQVPFLGFTYHREAKDVSAAPTETETLASWQKEWKTYLAIKEHSGGHGEANAILPTRNVSA